MKNKILLAALLLLATESPILAQHWSAGYRTGIHQSNLRIPFGGKATNDLKWSNQLFLTRKIAKRLEAELTVTYNSQSASDSTMMFDGPFLTVTNIRSHTITAGIFVRYHVLQCAKWSAFAQAGFTNYQSWNNYKGLVYNDPGDPPYAFSGSNKTDIVFAHTLSAGAGCNYNLSRRFYLNANMNLAYKPSAQNEMTYNPSHFSFFAFAGAGFRF